MATQFHRAQKRNNKFRLIISGPDGSGKTHDALMTGFDLGGPVALIDVWGNGAELAHLGEYDICSLAAPLTPEKYLEAIAAAEKAGYQVIIVDSLPHDWWSPGGAPDSNRQTLPHLKELKESLEHSRCHIIVTVCTPGEDEATTANGNPSQPTTPPASAAPPPQPAAAGKKRLF